VRHLRTIVPTITFLSRFPISANSFFTVILPWGRCAFQDFRACSAGSTWLWDFGWCESRTTLGHFLEGQQNTLWPMDSSGDPWYSLAQVGSPSGQGHGDTFRSSELEQGADPHFPDYKEGLRWGACIHPLEISEIPLTKYRCPGKHRRKAYREQSGGGELSKWHLVFRCDRAWFSDFGNEGWWWWIRRLAWMRLVVPVMVASRNYFVVCSYHSTWTADEQWQHVTPVIPSA